MPTFLSVQSEPSAPGGVESKLLESLLYVDDKLLQIRYSETEIDREYYAKKGLQNILEQGQSILAKSTTFSVIPFILFPLFWG
jgi:hypothetical protein